MKICEYWRLQNPSAHQAVVNVPNFDQFLLGNHQRTDIIHFVFAGTE